MEVVCNRVKKLIYFKDGESIVSIRLMPDSWIDAIMNGYTLGQFNPDNEDITHVCCLKHMTPKVMLDASDNLLKCEECVKEAQCQEIKQ